MIQVYINYPNPRITIHRDLGCSSLHQHHSPFSRVIKVNPLDMQAVIQKMKDPEFRFRSEQGFNDLYLEIDFGDFDFEQAVAVYLLKILSRRYSPFQGLEPEIHCPK